MHEVAGFLPAAEPKLSSFEQVMRFNSVEGGFVNVQIEAPSCSNNFAEFEILAPLLLSRGPLQVISQESSHARCAFCWKLISPISPLA